MNRHLHRLVWSRRLGMLVAVAEAARSVGRAAGGTLAASPAVALVLGAVVLQPGVAQAQTTARPPARFAGQATAPTAARPLPQPYANTADKPERRFAYDPKAGPASADLLQQGRVNWTVNGRNAVFDQGSVERVVLNWDSFDIGAGYSVHFKQDTDPTKYVSALNRIWSASPSAILGSLTADREVILLNSNGVYFGRGARVDTGKFIATANNIADAVFDKGLRNVTDGSAVFSTAGTDYRATNLDAAISVEAGAEIRTAAGGDVLLIAPRVVNQGRIETPRGQAVLAAGDKVYLMSSADPAQRGLIIAVDPVKNADGSNDTTVGSAENAAVGGYKTVGGATVADSTPDTTSGLVNRINEIRAESGTVNLVGLTVRQAGQVNATTAVKGANGAVYLQAMASTVALTRGNDPNAGASLIGRRGYDIALGTSARVGDELGSVELASGSVTAIRPDAGAATQLDAERFNPSLIRVEGSAVSVASGARIEAPAGRVELLAAIKANPASAVFNTGLNDPPPADASRVVIAPGAQISVAGLADVAIDGSRNQGNQRLFRIELADAPVQRSGPLYRSPVLFDLRSASSIAAANVTGAASAIGRTASERSAVGGSLRIESEGTVLIGSDARLDVSGGSLRYSQATLQNTLLDQGGRTLLFRSAPAGVAVDGVLEGTQSQVVPAYTEGKDGGRLLINGRVAAVAGELVGQVVQGERQRDGTSSRAAPAALTLGREIGFSRIFYLAGIDLQAGQPPALDTALFEQPLTASLSALPATTALSLDAVQRGGFGALSLRARTLTQATASSLDLGVQGVLDLLANRVDLSGSFSAAGGSFSLATLSGATPDLVGREDLTLAGSAVLDTAGRWTNDTAGGGGGDVQTAGGKLTVTSARSLLLQPGATVDVSAGARLAAGGALTRGKAGSITLAAARLDSVSPPALLQLQGTRLRGHDFSTGGQLSVSAPGSVVFGTASDAGLALDAGLLSDGGFGSVAVQAYGDLRVASGTLLTPRLRNWDFADAFRTAPSGAMNASVAVPVVPDERLATPNPVNVSLAATRTSGSGAGQTGGSVVVERGAGVDLAPGASLSLAATRNVEVGARGGAAGQASVLSAPGGTLTLQVSGIRGEAGGVGTDPVGFLPDQAIWLGADARLSVAGTAQLRPEIGATVAAATSAVTVPGDRVTRRVLGGGTIALDAQRGYVVAAAGSSMVLDGAAATLNVPGIAAPVVLARPAGTLRASTPEGLALEGRVSARAPVDATGAPLADGGVLDVAVGAGGVNAQTSGRPYTTQPRQIRLAATADALQRSGAVPGSDLAAALDNGIGVLGLGLLNGAGFDSLRLAAGDVVRFDSSMTLAPGRGIAFDTPALTSRPGTQVTLAAADIRIGDGTTPLTGRVPVANAGANVDTSPGRDTQLRLQAQTLEIVGTSALQGYSRTELQATGEIRAMGRGLSGQGADSLVGSLDFAGDLALQARQMYAISGASFTFTGLPGASRWSLSATPGVAAGLAPLSTFGTMAVNADRIEQGGVLRQPFGSITLAARDTLTLAADSLTSVSSDGQAQLYGSTENLAGWLLPSASLATTQLPVAKGVQLSGASIDARPGATVDARGGGDVLAWEFFRGVGGSTDTLAGSDVWAVLPAYNGTRSLAYGSGRLDATQQGRQLVVTLAGSGLAPGRYDLMPARDALLAGSLPEGAYLVRRATDQGRTALASALHQDDGSTVVTGYLTRSGSINTGLPGERWVIAPPATFQAQSEQRLTSVSALLAGLDSGTGTRRAVPRDGGQVAVQMTGTGSARWNAGLRLAADGGRAGLLDITAPKLALLGGSAAAPADALAVPTALLADSGASSVLLGGLRSSVATPAASTVAGPAWRIDNALAGSVAVDLGGAALAVEELVLTARDSVSLAPGTRIAGTNTATLGAHTYTASGDGAVALAGASAVDVLRTGAALQAGDLRVGAGSVLQGQQVTLDATGQLTADASTQLQTARLNLGARRIIVGAGAAADAGATVLSGALLQTARQADSLALRSYGSIDFIGAQDWAGRAVPGDATSAPTTIAASLVLDTPVLRGLAAADGTPARTDIAARSIVLRNSSGQAPATSATGTGTLLLQALPPLRFGSTGGLAMGPGTLALSYADAALRSSGDVVLQGTGSTAAQGNLTLAAARLTAATGADQAVTAATGTLAIDTQAGSRTLDERVGQGARVQLSGRTVRQDGRIDLPGGALAITATGADVAGQPALSFGTGSGTSVAGYALPGLGGFDAYGMAGSIAATATAGRLSVQGVLDVSAAAQASGTAGDAGRIDLQAPGSGGTLLLGGTLRGRAGSGADDRGGSLRVDVGTLPAADTLAQAARDGGLDREVSLRVRSGDVSLATDVVAERIALSADAGRLALGTTTLDARAASGGVVQLTAGNDLQLGAGTRIDTRSSRAGANGGDVLLGSTSGRVRLDAAAQVDATGDDAADGRIVLRALRGDDNASVRVDPLNAGNLQAGQVDVEAVRVYRTVGAGAAARNITSIAATTTIATGVLGQATVRADSNALATAAPAVLAGLGVAAADSSRVRVRAGVEVQAAGDLTVAAPWLIKDPENTAVASRRANEDAGALTLRAAGNLNVNAAISDGFVNATAASALLSSGTRDASLRLVAGADLAAAQPLAVRDLGGGTVAAGILTIAGNQFVRTGAGSIDLAAGRNIVFGPGAASSGQAYVAGRRQAGAANLLATLFAGQGNATQGKPQFTEQGGRLTLQAQGDITAPEGTQLANNWLWRSGLVSTGAADAGLYNAQSHPAWWTEFSLWRQTVGSFGGGDLLASAGRNIVNLQAMAPTQGWADSRVIADAALQVRNGGDLDVRAGGDLLAGQYLVGRGIGRLAAGGSIAALAANTRLDETALALLDGGWRLSARGALTTTGAYNPTAMPAPTANARSGASGFFYTWDGNASLDAVAASGTLSLSALKVSGSDFGFTLASPQEYARVMPATLSLTSAGASLLMPTDEDAVLYPAARSGLRLWAGGDIVLGRRLAMADTPLALWPDFSRPLSPTQLSTLGTLGLIGGVLNDTQPHASLHAGDAEPARIHAQGSLLSTSDSAALVLPKQARLSAGGDVDNLRLVVQNLSADDVSSVSAGRDYSALRTLVGVQVAGPGAFEISAGRNLNLGNSTGVTTIGNQRSAGLAAAGASIRLAAAEAATLDMASFEASYLAEDAAVGSARAQAYRDALLARVRDALKQPGLDYAAALAQFRGFPAAEQAAFGRQVLASEFAAVYLGGAAPTAAEVRESLRAAFERHRAELLAAAERVLAAPATAPESERQLVLPGRNVLTAAELPAYIAAVRAVEFTGLDLDTAIATRVSGLARLRDGWREAVATSLGGTVAGLSALEQQAPQDPRVQAWQSALTQTTGRLFQDYRQRAMASEIAAAGAAASQFGTQTLPMRLAWFDLGFQAAELGGQGSFTAQPYWTGVTPVLQRSGAMELTQSGLVTERGGAISLLNPGGAISVGLKETSSPNARGVITRGGGDIFGYARSDFQVNTQRVFVVGQGDMTLWSSLGDIDSGRGANTAVAAPPLVPRRSADGVVFELAATTTGSGLGIVEDAAGQRSGTIGLYPALGEILALDAFIRAPSVIAGSSVRGADNLQSARIGGAAVAVAAPPAAVAPPPASTDNRPPPPAATSAGGEARARNSLLTVELLGLGRAPEDDNCDDKDRVDGRCRKPAAGAPK